jgi:hypothetical protein
MNKDIWFSTPRISKILFILSIISDLILMRKRLAERERTALPGSPFLTRVGLKTEFVQPGVHPFTAACTISWRSLLGAVRESVRRWAVPAR